MLTNWLWKFAKRPVRSRHARESCCGAVEQLEDRTLLSTFTVTNTANSGAGSLRQAILDSNAAGGSNTINFDITTSGAKVISLTSALPAITSQVTLNGESQPGFAGVPLIEINGSHLPASSSAILEIDAANCTISGLDINGFAAGTGILINGAGATGNQIEDCHIGTDLAGAVAVANSNGIVIANGAKNNVIGSSISGSGNVISGNTNNGVLITGSGTTGNVLLSNLIGTNAAGTSAISNGTGVALTNGATGNSVGTSTAGNLISGNTTYGVLLSGATTAGNAVQDDLIGTNASGTAALGSFTNVGGVVIAQGAHGNVVGGASSAARNVISGNASNGVSIIDSGSSQNVVEGNYIGTNASGTGAVANGGNGVFINTASNIIGGTASGAGNVISGNAVNGVEITNSTATGNVLFGNFIGTESDGATALSNRADGVLITSSASNNTIGGLATGDGNTIRTNGSTGVLVASGVGNSIRGNSIFSNGALGIDLNGDGVTKNDTGDFDNGANGLQNFPVISSVTTTAGTVGSSTGSMTIAGSINSVANSTYSLDFYTSASPNAANYGEGQTYLGSTTVTTDAQGNATYQVTFSVTLPTGPYITATATDQHGNTSEFSQVFPLNSTNAINEPPVNTLPGAQVTLVNVPLSFTAASGNLISISDGDAGTNTVQVALAATHGTLSLGKTTGLTFSAQGGRTGSTSLLFTGTIANINAALATLQFTPVKNFTGAAGLTITTNDLGHTGSGGAKSTSNGITITVLSTKSVDQPPVNTIPGAQTTVQNTALVFAAANGNGISISDPDAGGSPVQVTLTATQGTITLGQTLGLTFTQGAGGSGPTLTFTGTMLNINAALNGMTFTPTSGYIGNASLQISTNDLSHTGTGGPKITTNTVQIGVTSVNPAPVIGLAAAADSYRLGSAAINVDGTATVTGIPNFAGGTLTVKFAANGTPQDILSIRNQGTSAGLIGISGNQVLYGGVAIGTFSGGGGTTPLVISLNASASTAAVQALARDITYQAVGFRVSPFARSVQFVVTDGQGGTSNAATKTILV